MLYECKLVGMTVMLDSLQMKIKILETIVINR